MGEQEEEQEKEESKEENRNIASDKVVLMIIGGLILVFAALLAIVYLTPEKEAMTEEKLHQLNIQGKLDPDEGYMYKDMYSFVFYDGLWHTQLQGEGMLSTIRTHYGPRELEDIPIRGDLNETLFDENEEYHATFDPTSEEEIMKYVALSWGEFMIPHRRDFQKTAIASCIKNETEACEGNPIITCDNTNMPVIYWEVSEKTQVLLDDNCIMVQGKGEEMLKATDRLLFSLYNVME